ncbi:MAG: hypothetical protein HY782_27355 [Chloroflexi bacterium]|nr:hypothetical protein [Chloroflexota bacterium]
MKPGESTILYTDIVMHEGMGGRHIFDIPLQTNDATQKAKTLRVVSIWGP